MYKILDIDLDFFQDERITYEMEGTEERPSSDLCPPWSIDRVRSFIEQKCGLSANKKCKGVVFIDHDELFKYCICNNLSDIELFHIDAHHDIYCYKWKWMMEIYMNESIENRSRNDVISDKINEGNFLLFLNGCGLLSKLNYITNKEKKWDDMPEYCFKGLDKRSKIIQIPRVTDKNPIPLAYYPADMLSKYDKLAWDSPETEFNCIDYRDFVHDQNYDLVCLTKSPKYTSVETDKLFDILTEYII